MTVKKFNGDLTEAQFKSRVVSSLRLLSRWWGPKQEAIGRARIKRGVYKCESCGIEGPGKLPPESGKKRKRKNIQADHIIPVVPLTGWVSYDDWIERCFVGANGFQAICWRCHTDKTGEERKERTKLKNIKK